MFNIQSAIVMVNSSAVAVLLSLDPFQDFFQYLIFSVFLSVFVFGFVVKLAHGGLQVHERQTERMRTRSEWFLTPTAAAHFECAYGGCLDSDPTLHVLRGANARSSSSNIGELFKRVLSSVQIFGSIATIALLLSGAGLSVSAESVQKRPSLRRTNSRSEKTRHLVHRNSSRRNKENGQRGATDRSERGERPSGSGDYTPPTDQLNIPSNVSLAYKPRI